MRYYQMREMHEIAERLFDDEGRRQAFLLGAAVSQPAVQNMEYALDLLEQAYLAAEWAETVQDYAYISSDEIARFLAHSGRKIPEHISLV